MLTRAYTCMGSKNLLFIPCLTNSYYALVLRPGGQKNNFNPYVIYTLKKIFNCELYDFIGTYKYFSPSIYNRMYIYMHLYTYILNKKLKPVAIS